MGYCGEGGGCCGDWWRLVVWVVAAPHGRPVALTLGPPLNLPRLCSKSPSIVRLLEQKGILFQKSIEIVVTPSTTSSGKSFHRRRERTSDGLDEGRRLFARLDDAR